MGSGCRCEVGGGAEREDHANSMKMTPTRDAAEEDLIAAIVEAMLEKQRRKLSPGDVARRVLHGKSHGTVRARFQVRGGLPSSLAVGLFAEPRTYEAVARFSNGAHPAGASDLVPNIRGAALKLLGVPGPKALPGDEAATELDFVLANHPVFFATHMKHMLMLIQGRMREMLRDDPRVVALLLASMMKLVRNPLELRYYSQVPYAWGDRAGKFALLPVQPAPFLPLPRSFHRDYLRQAVERTLGAGETAYVFCIQLQEKPAEESLEDSTRAWPGPYVPVADVTFLTRRPPIPESEGEGLSFNPWRTREEHRPLGWPGRVRHAAYAADFAWRTAQNQLRTGGLVVT